jgi:hypothetical protein
MSGLKIADRPRPMAIGVGFSWPLQTRPNHHLIFLKKARQGILLALMEKPICRCNGVRSPLKTSRTFVTKPKGFLFGAAPIISMLLERRGITNFTSGTPRRCPAWDDRWCRPAAQQAWRRGGYGYYGYPTMDTPLIMPMDILTLTTTDTITRTAYGYSYDSGNPFAAVTAPIAALTAPATALAAPVARAAVAPFAVATSGTAPLVTGRSVAVGQMGKMCSTPVKSFELYQASYVGNGCSCKVTGGRSRGTVTT